MSKFEALVDEAVRRRAEDFPMPSRALEDLIRDKGGHSLKLIIQKRLYKTDVDKGKSRLSMPLKQICDVNFLNQDEKMRSTKNDGVDVDFIGPRLEETTMVLRKWNFTRSSSYVLRKNWNKIVTNNGLKKGDTVQVWSFRVDTRLCFALVKPANLNHI